MKRLNLETLRAFQGLATIRALRLMLRMPVKLLLNTRGCLELMTILVEVSNLTKALLTLGALEEQTFLMTSVTEDHHRTFRQNSNRLSQFHNKFSQSL